MQKLVNITINNKKLTVPNDYTILKAAEENNIFIPRLCFLKDVNENSSCRICVVEIEGIKTLKNSCTVNVNEGMVVTTNSPRVKKAVKLTLELLAANHKFDCWKCPRERNCEFLTLLRRYGVDTKIADAEQFVKKLPIYNNKNTSIKFDSGKCILCSRCVGACENIAGIGVINYNDRGFVTTVGTPLNHDAEDAGCIYCGKCIQACPTGAISEKDDTEIVESILEQKDKYVVVQMAPAVRAAIGEEFGFPIGTNTEGKMYAALKELGFDDITDVNFAADVTIMEEGTEFLSRISKLLNNEDVALPMLTSCSPGWIRYIEQYYPKYLDNLSTVKSPQQIQGSLIKNYYADKINVNPNDVVVVSIMPCIAKKSEAAREELQVDGRRDVDVVLTTRELARLIKRAGIDFNNLPDYKPETPLAKYTGAGVIFGATGGVMEAALRTVVEKLDPKTAEKMDLSALRGVESGIKEATLSINGLEVNVAVVHGTKNLPILFEKIEKGEKNYHFIEVMACTGGCVNGGGQPIVTCKEYESLDVRKLRAQVLYNIDENSEFRKSHTNPEVTKLYDEFLKEPNSHLAHKLLHTTYKPKKIFSK